MEPYANVLISVAVFGGIFLLLKVLKKGSGTTYHGGTTGATHGAVKILSHDGQFDQELAMAGNKPVLVDFTASWCGPCQRIGPYFEQLSTQYPGLVFLKVDVDHLSATSQRCGVRAMPTFQVFHGSRKVDEFTGASPESLKRLCDKWARR